jgi:hypothetical protein
LGVEVGGYKGLGYKGSAESEALENAYKDGFYTGGVSGQIPHKFVSGGIDTSISADDRHDFGLGDPSGGDGLAALNPQAVKTVTMGGSLGVSLSPLPGGAHVDATNYNYLFGQPFDSQTQMLGFIWADPLLTTGDKIILTLLIGTN